MSTIDKARAKLAGTSIPSLGELAVLFKGVPEVIGSLPAKPPEPAATADKLMLPPDTPVVPYTT